MGRGRQGRRPEAKLSVLNFLKNTLWLYFLWVTGNVSYTGKCPSQVPPQGAGDTPCPALGASPLPNLLVSSLANCSVHLPEPAEAYWVEEVMKLFSMQRTMRALWQLVAFCSSSLPASSEEAWPVAPAASVRQVSQ